MSDRAGPARDGDGADAAGHGGADGQPAEACYSESHVEAGHEGDNHMEPCGKEGPAGGEDDPLVGIAASGMPADCEPRSAAAAAESETASTTHDAPAEPEPCSLDAELAALGAQEAELDVQAQHLQRRKEALVKQAELQRRLKRKRSEMEALKAEIAQLEHEAVAFAEEHLGLDRPTSSAKRQRTQPASAPNLLAKSKPQHAGGSISSGYKASTTVSTAALLGDESAREAAARLARIQTVKVQLPRAAEPRPVVVKPEFVRQDPPDVETEPRTGIRIKNRIVTAEMLDQRMLNRQVVSIKSVGAGLMREDVEQDWVMIGVIWSKSENKIAKNGSSFVMMRICDLAGNSINLFMFRESFEAHWKEKVGSVVAVLNPKIMAPLEKQTQVSIELDNPLKWMKIGDAVDLGTCQGIRRDKNPCQLPIDVGQYCTEHTVGALRAARIGRQELAAGTSGLHLGNPSVLAEERKRRVNVDGTFKVDGVTISTQGQDIKLIEPNRPDDPLTAQDEANLRKIAELAAGKSVGARYLRAAHKIPEPAAKVADQPLFSRTAIMLMGGNPLANDSTKQRSPSTTPKAARVHDFIAGKGDLTPSRSLVRSLSAARGSESPRGLERADSHSPSRHSASGAKRSAPATRDDSDSDVELNII